MNKFNINKLKMIVCAIVLLSIINVATAFGVTAPYWDAKPLTMHPGETRDIQLTLQNMVGNKDITFKANIEEGLGIAQLTDKNPEYQVPFGVKDVAVNVRITIPADAEAGTQQVGVSFNQITEPSGETGKLVQLGGGVKGIIPVVIEVPNSGLLSGAAIFDSFSSSTMIFGAVLFIIIALIIVYFMFRRDEII